MNTLSGKSHGRMRKYYYSCTAHFSTIIVPNGKKQARKCPFYRLLRAFENYSNSVVPNLFLFANHVKFGILIFHNYLKCLVFLVLFEEIVSF